MIPGQAQQFFEAAAAQSGASAYEVERSLRFNSADSAYLNRTPSSASNRRTWTWSGWVKRSPLGAQQPLFNAGVTSSQQISGIAFFNDDKLELWSGVQGVSTEHWCQSLAVFRDSSAWYHIVVAVDTTQSTAADRVKLYVNNSSLDITGYASYSTYPSQNYSYAFDDTVAHQIARDTVGTPAYGNGYLAEVNFIDGQALAPTDFGEYDSNNNWNPKDTSGLTFGTNGFYLKFADNSSNSALGTDSSGNNNTWTVNNLVADVSSSSNGMNVVTYSGTGSSQSITGLGFQPDLVWVKRRDSSADHNIQDVIRGLTAPLYSNLTNAEGNFSQAITAFDSDGFTVGTGGDVNNSSGTYVAWCWKAGGTASSNSDGTITSSVSANPSYGFSIVSYTGTGSGGATVGHGLGDSPKFIIIKNRSDVENWFAWNSSLASPEVRGLYLDSTADQQNFGSTSFNNTLPSSSVITLGSANIVNGSSDEMIAYCWSEVPSFSSFGSYTGNGSTSGPTITTGFRPRFILLKAATINGEDWVIMDTARSTSNPSNLLISPNNNSQEFSNSAYNTDFNDDGFTIKNTNPRWNTSGETYIYAAFAEKPDQSIIDSLLDTPTNYEADSGNNGGNYATLNALNRHSTSNDTVSNGNLECSMASGSAGLTPSTIGFSSGKFYYEVVFSGSVQFLAGIRRSDSRNYDNSYTYHADGNKYTNGGSATSYGATFTDGDVIGVAVDMDAGTLTFYKNGVSQGQAFSGISGNYTFIQGKFSGSGGSYIANFGQRPFSYTPPANHLALCTQNLTDPTIAEGSTAMDVATYDGNATTQTISGLGFSPDFIWIKERTDTGGVSHYLGDTVRGVNKALASNTTSAESTDDIYGYISAATSDGFTVTAGSSDSFYTNGSPETYVAWTWDGGTSTVSNTDGSITSSVRANASAGFSIVSYTGDGSSSATVGHGLNASLGLILHKNRDAAANWNIKHSSLASNHGLAFTTTQSQDVTTAYSGGGFANLTSSSTFGFLSGTSNADNVNQNTVDYIAYCFAPVEGYSAFGSYTGNGSTDGPFVYTGFRPKFIFVKISSATGNWIMYDTSRDTYNVVSGKLYPNLSSAEDTTTGIYDFLSNGFKAKHTGATNTNGATYVWAAFAEHPFKTARAR